MIHVYRIRHEVEKRINKIRTVCVLGKILCCELLTEEAKC